MTVWFFIILSQTNIIRIGCNKKVKAYTYTRGTIKHTHAWALNLLTASSSL